MTDVKWLTERWAKAAAGTHVRDYRSFDCNHNYYWVVSKPDELGGEATSSCWRTVLAHCRSTKGEDELGKVY